MRAIGVFVIKLYQRLISPFFPSACRFYPTCSNYGIEAIEKYGLLKGIAKTAVRLSKCHPLHPGGFDPVEKPQQNLIKRP